MENLVTKISVYPVYLYTILIGYSLNYCYFVKIIESEEF